MVTSAVTYGDVVVALAEGERLVPASIVNQFGYPSTDSKDALTGSITTVADYKGFGLSLVIELLAGPLVRAKAGRIAVPGSWGFLSIMIDPNPFVAVNDFREKAW